MRAFVFTDQALTGQAGRFVWLEIDTEKAKNAPFRQKYSVPALPSFFIVNPADERVVIRWIGGMTSRQLLRLLDEGRLAGAGGSPGGARAADSVLAVADRLYGEGKNTEAADAYEDALGAAPGNWPRFARVMESLTLALSLTDDDERCARLARESFTRLRGTPSSLSVAATGLDCAVALPSDHASRAELIASLEADVRQVLADTTLAVAGDDRSGAYISLIGALKDAQDEAGARRAAGEWSAFLDGAAARAVTPEQRAVYDPHRLNAYIEIGHPERAIPMLEASQRDFPADYNPPARLAIAYKEMKRWDEALAASDRALAMVYGPRQLVLLQTRAEIYSGRGDREDAKRTLERAVATAEGLPPGQRNEGTIASLKKKLAALQ